MYLVPLQLLGLGMIGLPQPADELLQTLVMLGIDQPQCHAEEKKGERNTDSCQNCFAAHLVLLVFDLAVLC